MATEAAEAKGVTPVDWSAFETRAAPVAALPKQEPDATCYLQYSSGSTRFPHGVAVTHAALLNTLAAHAHGMRSEEHTSELQSLMSNSYAVSCLQKKQNTTTY